MSARSALTARRRAVTALLTTAALLAAPAAVAGPAQGAVGDSRVVTASGTGGHSSPSWSPDSTTLLFTYHETTSSLWRQRLDRTTPSLLRADDEDLWWPRMSPNGKKVAYTVFVEDTATIRVLTLATGTVTEMGAATGLDLTREASWSRDGTRLVFSGVQRAGGYYRIYTARPDGTDLVPVTEGVEGRNQMQPAWSPDGTTIAFTQWDDPPEVRLVDAAGGNERTIAGAAAGGSWSPDSLRLAITDISGSRSQLRIIDTDGTTLEDLTSSYRDGDPSWSPDGSYLAFTRTINGRSRIWVRSFGPAIPAAVAPPAPTVSIDGGALYTNTRRVTLHVTAPEGAETVRVSNDGGFSPAQTFAVDTRIPWTLADTVADRLPKTVYVRYGSGPVYTDDIILDQVHPVIDSAATTQSSQRVAVGTVRTQQLRTVASDNRSGVRRIQANKTRSRVGAATQRYQTRVEIPVWRTTYVRVRDGAGNWSRWRLAR